MNFVKLASLAVVGTVLAVAGASAQDKTVKIATEGAYAPWRLATEPRADKLEGFEIDLANDLCARMKVKCEIVAQDWDGIIPALQAKKYDAIMAGMSITADRKKVIELLPSLRHFAINGWPRSTESPLAKMPGDAGGFNLSAHEAQAEQGGNRGDRRP